MKRKKFAVSILLALFCHCGNSNALSRYRQKRSDIKIPSLINGVELSSLEKPVIFSIRYPTWDYLPEYSTIIPLRAIPGTYANEEIVANQNRELDTYGIAVDILQFNPNPHYPDLERYKESYFAVESERPFFVLYEHHFGHRFQTLDDGVFIDLEDDFNKRIFIEDIERILTQFVVPFESRYVTTANKRAIIYLWASQIFRNAVPLLGKVKSRYPVEFIGSEDPFTPPPDEDSKKRIWELYAVMPYSTYASRYGSFEGGEYMVMAEEYYLGIEKWRDYIKQWSPHTNIFFTFQIAFDKTKSPRNASPPLYPRSIGEVLQHAYYLRDFMDRGVGESIVSVVYDERFEGAAVEHSLPPERDEAFYEIRELLSGTTRLEVIRAFFKQQIYK